MNICTHIYVYIYIYICIHIYVIYIYIYTYVYSYIHVYAYIIYIHLIKYLFVFNSHIPCSDLFELTYSWISTIQTLSLFGSRIHTYTYNTKMHTCVYRHIHKKKMQGAKQAARHTERETHITTQITKINIHIKKMCWINVYMLCHHNRSRSSKKGANCHCIVQ